MPNNNSAFVPGRHVTNLDRTMRGIILKVEDRPQGIRVLQLSTNSPVWYDVSELRANRGRPAHVHPSGLCATDVVDLINNSKEFCQAAISELYGRQNPMEQARATTIDRNEVGFRADHARRGCILAALAPDAWGESEYSTARSILVRYSGTQLLDLAASRPIPSLDS
jgi:hypothetical protein